MSFRDVPQNLRAYLDPRMQYSEPVKILHELGMDGFVTLLVVGHPDMGSYEWVLARRVGGSIDKHSDSGYGCADIALRDGLIAYHGLPSAFDELRKRLLSEPPAGVARARAHYAGLVNDAIKTIDVVEGRS